MRDGSWKLILGPPGRGADAGSSVHLYNLAEDLGEKKNLAAEMPEKAAEMKALYEKLITDGRSTPGAKQSNDVPVRCFPQFPKPQKR